jgi:hypothetical protein
LEFPSSSLLFAAALLTALALEQGGYDGAILAYAVGFGGSMIWFGSSAGVAVSNLFPEAKSAIACLRAVWWLPAAYVAGFFVMLGLLGWRPLPRAHRGGAVCRWSQAALGQLFSIARAFA